MDNLFLPREVGSIETGPQIFAGTDVPNTTFNFVLIVDVPGLLNSVIVQNGGYSQLNGIFNYTTEYNGKPYYNKDGYAYWFIVWIDNKWNIYDFETSIDPIYYSTQDVPYPWNVTIWTAFNPAYNPVPTAIRGL
jgi:hypothetical protein